MLRKVQILACLALAGVLSWPAQAHAADELCAANSPASYDDLSGIWSPCVTARGALVTEATYLQNASAVGGTALAAYPMLDLRTGVAAGLELAFHTPSQVAESGPHGIGLYPATHLGYGLRYGLRETPRFALAVATDVLPPMSRFAPNQIQPRYVLGLSSAYAVNSKLSVGLATTATSSGSVGFQRILPADAFKAAYTVSSRTNIVTDLGTRFPGVRAPQSFGDVAVNQTLSRHMMFKVGLGTTFNSAMNNKAHYLASGFNYKI